MKVVIKMKTNDNESKKIKVKEFRTNHRRIIGAEFHLRWKCFHINKTRKSFSYSVCWKSYSFRCHKQQKTINFCGSFFSVSAGAHFINIFSCACHRSLFTVQLKMMCILQRNLLPTSIMQCIIAAGTELRIAADFLVTSQGNFFIVNDLNCFSVDFSFSKMSENILILAIFLSLFGQRQQENKK